MALVGTVLTTVAKTLITVQRSVETPVATEEAAAATGATGAAKGQEERLRAEVVETGQAETDPTERLNLGPR